MSSAPVLGEATEGDTLELHPSGSWTAAYAAPLESLFDAVSRKLQQAAILKIDMADVRELDTLGARLLEKMSRRALEAGHSATVINVADRYKGLIDDIRQINRRKPPIRVAQNPVLGRLEAVGRSTFSAAEDVSVFLQMLGVSHPWPGGPRRLTMYLATLD